MAEKLSKSSIYEQLFGTRHRAVGRPAGDSEPLFPSNDRDPVIVRVALRRAYAVVHEENRARLNEVFEKEMQVLQRRGVEIVARDAKIPLPAPESSSAELSLVGA